MTSLKNQVQKPVEKGKRVSLFKIAMNAVNYRVVVTIFFNREFFFFFYTLFCPFVPALSRLNESWMERNDLLNLSTQRVFCWVLFLFIVFLFMDVFEIVVRFDRRFSTHNEPANSCAVHAVAELQPPRSAINWLLPI